MAENSKIEWCSHTFNPWVGCTKVSPACNNCYAESYGKRFGVKWGAGQQRNRTSESTWKQPLRWNRKAELKIQAWENFKRMNPGLTDAEMSAQGFIKPQRPRVFCASLSDVFDNEVPPEWRADLFRLIGQTPGLDWLLLTKRVVNAIPMMLNEAVGAASNGFFGWLSDGGHQRFSNVWIGATVCSQEEADRDIPKLLKIPAAKRFVSIEPLLGPIDLYKACSNDRWADPDGVECCALPRHLDWVIVGGESGSNARPMHPQWARDIRDQCAQSNIPFLFKQWGEYAPPDDIDAYGKAHHGYWEDCPEDGGVFRHEWNDHTAPCMRTEVFRVGKKCAGRLLDGVLYDEYPEA